MWKYLTLALSTEKYKRYKNILLLYYISFLPTWHLYRTAVSENFHWLTSQYKSVLLLDTTEIIAMIRIGFYWDFIRSSERNFSHSFSRQKGRILFFRKWFFSSHILLKHWWTVITKFNRAFLIEDFLLFFRLPQVNYEEYFKSCGDFYNVTNTVDFGPPHF